MADITTLGIRVDLDEVRAAVKALEQLSKSAEKTEDSTDKVTNSFARAAKAIKNLEQANLAQEKTATQAAKTAAALAATQESSANQQASRARAQIRLEEGIANQKAITAKRVDLLSSKEAQAAALSQKYSAQAAAAQERANAFVINQQSLVENRVLATQNRISQGAQRLALQQEKFEFQKAQAAERAARRAGSAWDNIKSGAQQFIGGAAAALGFAGTAGAALSILKTADNMTLLDSRLKLATKSQEDFVRTQEALRQSSLKTGLNLESQIAGYTQLERSTRAIGLTSKQLTFLTESFGKAAVVSGADAASYQSALTQLNQGFASGVIRGQEFNSVAEQAPAIMEALAAGLRGNNKEFDALEKKGYLGVAALRKLAGEGKLVNSVTIPALLEGLKATNTQFDQMPLTVQRATEQLSTAYKIWISNQNNASGSTTLLANSIAGLSRNFGTLVDSVVTVGAVVAAVFAGKIVSSITSAITASKAWSIVIDQTRRQNIASAQESLNVALANQAVAKSELDKARATTSGLVATQQSTAANARYTAASQAVAVAQANVAVAQERVAITTRAVTVATSAFSGVMSALGGPIGLAITALSLLVVAWANTETAAEKARNTAIAAANDIKRALAEGKIGEAETLKSGVETKLDNANKRLQNLVQQEAKLQQIIAKSGENTLIGGNTRRDGGVTAAEALQAVQVQLKAAAQEAAGYRGEFVKINDEIAKFRSQPAIEPTKLITGPQTEDKPKPTPLLSAKESDYARALANTQALQLELATTKMLGLEKGNVNEYTKKALQLQAQLDALNPSAKNYSEAKTNLELAIAQEKVNAKLKDEIDLIQDQNKAINGWREEVDKLINKQEELATYNTVDLASKAGETYQEAAARRTKENYQKTLDILKEIARVRVSGQAAGVAPSEIEQTVGRVLGARSGVPAEASFSDQLAIVNNEMFVANANGEVEKYKQLEELRTAILEEQTRQRNELRKQESESVRQQVVSLQSGTESILAILESSGAKQTGIYKALFAVNKAFAIANSIIKIQQGIAEASSLPFPANLGAMATVAASTASIVSTIAGTDAQFAKGGAFVGGDVVNTPTTFPMSGGRTGLMGEAGAEAIMPLARDANGRLGVTVNGGGSSSGGIVQQNKIEITVQGGNTNEETAGVISRELLRTMETIAKNQIVQAKRPGGALA